HAAQEPVHHPPYTSIPDTRHPSTPTSRPRFRSRRQPHGSARSGRSSSTSNLNYSQPALHPAKLLSENRFLGDPSVPPRRTQRTRAASPVHSHTRSTEPIRADPHLRHRTPPDLRPRRPFATPAPLAEHRTAEAESERRADRAAPDFRWEHRPRWET